MCSNCRGKQHATVQDFTLLMNAGQCQCNAALSELRLPRGAGAKLLWAEFVNWEILSRVAFCTVAVYDFSFLGQTTFSNQPEEKISLFIWENRVGFEPKMNPMFSETVCLCNIVKEWTLLYLRPRRWASLGLKSAQAGKDWSEWTKWRLFTKSVFQTYNLHVLSSVTFW